MSYKDFIYVREKDKLHLMMQEYQQQNQQPLEK